MWHLPPALRERLHDSDFSVVFGSPANAAELEGLLEMYETIDWGDPAVVPFQNRKRRLLQSRNQSPGRQHMSCGDWVWFDP